MRLLDTVGTAVVFCSEALVDPVACAFRAGGIEAGSIGVRAGGVRLTPAAGRAGNAGVVFM